VLQYVGVLHLPDGPRRAAALQEQMAQTAWAGETEGWMTSEPKVRLVAEEGPAGAWLPLFEPAQNVEVIRPVPVQDLAQVTARRVAGDGATTNLLPPEFTARYKQRFVDQLWMRLLAAVIACYVLGVAVYIGLAQVAKFRYDSVQQEATALGVAYTNTIRLKERLVVMQDALDLQYAALECYRAISENLPEGVTLRSIRFDQGRKVTYSGSATPEDRTKILDLNASMRKAMMRDQPLFGNVNAPDIRPAPGGQTVSWSFACDLKRGETQ
jgi:Tfp pilus assembly protein PilN